MTMTEMLKATMTSRKRLQARDPNREITYFRKTFEIEGVGKVWCVIQLVPAGPQPWMKSALRKNWMLNNRRIAAQKLAEIVGA